MRRVGLIGCGLLTMGASWGQAPVVVRPVVSPSPVLKTVTGAPFSAVAVTRFTQMLADGNRISRTRSQTIFRDSAGRERAEFGAEGLTVLGEPVVASTVTISDPVAGTTYQLNSKEKTARSTGRVTFSIASLARANVGGGSAPRATQVVEQLGSTNVEGVYAEGTRTTSTIPAGQADNERDLAIVDEVWYSPDLQLNVKTRHYDPRSGETVYELTQINRSEPDASLFQVPAGYATAPQRPATLIVGNPDFKNGTKYILEPPK